MGQIFVAFSEYMNFNVLGLSRDLLIKMVFGAKAQHRGSLGWGGVGGSRVGNQEDIYERIRNRRLTGLKTIRMGAWTI